MKATAFTPGQSVTIISVAFPDLPHHAKFTGKNGHVRKIVKSRNVVYVVTDIGERECDPNRIQPYQQAA
jgi:ribosomal protein L21E